MEQVLGTHTPNTGRVVWNANDNLLESYTDALGADLDAHKASGDHDSHNDARYDPLGAAATVNGALNTHKASGDHDSHNDARYDPLGAAATVNGALNTHKTSGDHDSRYVMLSGNQNVDGEKTLLQSLNIKVPSASLNLMNASGNRLLSVATAGNGTPGNAQAVLVLGDGAHARIPFSGKLEPTGDVTVDLSGTVRANGQKLATEEYVQTRIRSGFYAVTLSVSAEATPNTIIRIGSNPAQIVPVPSGSRLVSLNYIQSVDDDSSASVYSALASVFFARSGYHCVYAVVDTGANFSGVVFPTVRVYAGQLANGEIIWAEIATLFTAQEHGLAGMSRFHLTLGFAF